MPPLNEVVLIAFGLTLFAGLATAIGSAIAFFARRTDDRFLSIAMAFSAEVMLYVSFREILTKAEAATSGAYGERWAAWATLLSFFGGIALIAVIDAVVPKAGNPHEARTRGDLSRLKRREALDLDARAPEIRPRLMRTGLFTALAIGIHNLPEGMVTFLAALEDLQLWIALAVAVALHNIPEGISVSGPIYYATGRIGQAARQERHSILKPRASCGRPLEGMRCRDMW